MKITWREVVLALTLSLMTALWIYERDHRHRVIINKVPGVTALCQDGTYSTSESSKGQCSHHGGVNQIFIRER